MSGRLGRTVGDFARRTGGLLLAGWLAACASQALDRAPPDPSKPWTPPSESGAVPPPASAAAAASGAATPAAQFTVAPNPAVAALTPTPGIDPRKTYSLPELIDIAQRQNPATRIAWEQARQAALASGMVEATYLPLISAIVVGGYQRFSQTLPVPVGNIGSVDETIGGISPQIALEWLLFDFGQRTALATAAKHNSVAANVLFTGVHQKIIFDVARTYFLYDAARSRVTIARQALANSLKIQDAADQRMREGLGTTVEVAQARQQVAQARFALVQAEGGERDSYQALLAAAGIGPLTEIRIASAAGRRLPAGVGKPTEELISTALARRPDVQASYSALLASQSGIDAAKAAFMPKVFLGAVAAGGSTNFGAMSLPTISQQSSASGVLVGVTMPIYDGGLRAAQLKNAETLVSASEATYHKVQDAAAREIVVTTDVLRSALASHRAAAELSRAAAITYDAALDAYRSGVGTITAATAADSGLLAARQAESDAHAASLVAAANLAFVLGAMTSRDSPEALAGR